MKLVNPIKWGFDPDVSNLPVLRVEAGRKIWAAIKAGHVVDQHFNDNVLQFATHFEAEPCLTVAELLTLARRHDLQYYGVASGRPDLEWWGGLLAWLNDEIVIEHEIPGKLKPSADGAVEPDIKPDKGMKWGSCNRTACQRPFANYFNKSTRRYYCAACAREINWPGGRSDTKALYGTPFLCELDVGGADEGLTADSSPPLAFAEVPAPEPVLFPVEPTPDVLLKVCERTGMARLELAGIYRAFVTAVGESTAQQ